MSAISVDEPSPGPLRSASDATPSAAVPSSPAGCVHFSDLDLTQWFSISELQGPTVLELQNQDIFDAHAALRHAHEVLASQYPLFVALPLELRKHPGFTPWLTSAVTYVRGKSSAPYLKEITGTGRSICVLQLNLAEQHVHAAADTAHFASFDIRVAGAMTRTLIDTGATCSCVTKPFLQRLGIPFSEVHSQNSIGGVGGTISTQGMIDLTLKLGKSHIKQQFLIISSAIAGYQCLLGQDFLSTHKCTISYGGSAVSLSLEVEGAQRLVSIRSLAHSQLSSYVPGKKSIATTVNASEESEDTPSSRREMKRMCRDIMNGKLMAYEVIFTPSESVTAVNSVDTVPSEVQAVLDKHSKGQGTLHGDIPPNTHIRGYDCHIELIPGAQPVQMRQYRLTPREREELEDKCKLFISKGWIEPSVSPWCSSVLFVPKPGNKLRFCVDYRRLNAVTKENKGPIPQPQDCLDRMQGAQWFTALDLAAGYYQLALDAESRELTLSLLPLALCSGE